MGAWKEPKQAETLFDRPLHRDWLAWWAAVVMLLSLSTGLDNALTTYAEVTPGQVLLLTVVLAAVPVAIFAFLPAFIRRKERRRISEAYYAIDD